MTLKKAFFGAMAGLLLLSGCQVAVTTDVSVESATAANLVASVTFENEAATAILGDATLEDQIEEILGKRTGSAVKRHSSDGVITYEAKMPYEKLADASGILGVQSALLNGDEDSAKLSLTLVRPTELIDAITAANSEQMDASSITSTVLKTSYVIVKVNYPGEITFAEGPGELTREGNRAELKMSLEQFEAGVMVTEGSLKEPLITTERVVLAGGVLVALLGFYLYRRRLNHR